MKHSLKADLQSLFPVWLGGVLLPLPALAFWRAGIGRSMALVLFSIGCASIVAYAFRRDFLPRSVEAAESPEQTWRRRMQSAGLALFSASAVFSVISLTLNDSQDFVEAWLAFMLPLPALGVVPFFMVVTRKPLAAVVFGIFTVFSMKLLGCIVVVLVYGWHASEHVPPYTDMPWTHPNLLVWLFWLNTAVLSLSLYVLGRKKFMRNKTVLAKAAR